MNRMRKLQSIAAVLATLGWIAVPRALCQGQPVVMNTTKGRIVMVVYPELMPVTASNFIDLVCRGFYNGLTFHRVENWVIQGGDPNGNGTGGFVNPSTGRERTIPLEINNRLTNVTGALAMAHSRDVNSAS